MITFGAAERCAVDIQQPCLGDRVHRAARFAKTTENDAIFDANGIELARGLINYNADDATRIIGMSRERIASRFGKLPYQELVHRDNLVVTVT